MIVNGFYDVLRVCGKPLRFTQNKARPPVFFMRQSLRDRLSCFFDAFFRCRASNANNFLFPSFARCPVSEIQTVVHNGLGRSNLGPVACEGVMTERADENNS